MQIKPDDVHRKTMLKALKIAVGSVAAIIIAEILQLPRAASEAFVLFAVDKSDFSLLLSPSMRSWGHII